eukprot:6879617-Prymnesium_polylepis.1
MNLCRWPSHKEPPIGPTTPSARRSYCRAFNCDRTASVLEAFRHLLLGAKSEVSAHNVRARTAS